MAKYDFEIQSRAMYAGPEERSFSELIEMSFIFDYSDDYISNGIFDAVANVFTIEVKSDLDRMTEDCNVYESEYIGSATQEKKIFSRRSFQVVPQAGFYGTFYQYKISKKVPSDGNLKFFMMTGYAQHVNVDQEFVVGMEAIEE